MLSKNHVPYKPRSYLKHICFSNLIVHSAYNSVILANIQTPHVPMIYPASIKSPAFTPKKSREKGNISVSFYPTRHILSVSIIIILYFSPCPNFFFFWASLFQKPAMFFPLFFRCFFFSVCLL